MKKTDSIYLTGIMSLIIQFLTGIIDLYVVFLPVKPGFFLIKQLLILELIVQIFEGTFYVWMVRNFQHIENITQYRYWDWLITTPTMLITFSFYLSFLKNTQEKQVNQDTFVSLAQKNWDILIWIIILNAIMLLFGYLGEIGKLSHVLATTLGFIPFFIYFFLVYVYFAKWTQMGQTLFFVFFGIWTTYGIASLMKYRLKNVMYNILDLFSKNLFGIFLAFILYINRG